MSDLLERLKSALTDRYTIEREIGRGGMAVVYLAQDLKHDRAVAVKVFEPEFASSIGSERFLREIRVTAQLNHPNILPLYDSGEIDGFLYYVMPYVPGESLRHRLDKEKQLPIDEALRIARDMGEAISHAHDLGIVHRDLKPANILLSSGRAVVADFGIARAVSAAAEGKLTQTGVAIGSPTYMSPEQASGETELDARSDVYSLGCIVYEMLGGDPPFSGATPQAILARKSLETVPPLRNVRETVPVAVERAVNKALAKVPADRFGTAQEFIEALESRTSVKQQAPITRKPWALAVIAVTVLSAGYLAFSQLTGSQAENDAGKLALVVLPLMNLGPPDEEFRADGVTDEITNRLARMSGLDVRGFTTALQYKGADKTITEIGEELDVDYVLEGTIQWERTGSGESRVVIRPQLIRASDDAHVWADVFDTTYADLFSLQADIAEFVAEALDVTLFARERRAIRRVPTENAEAHDAYLRGNQYSVWGGLLTDHQRAIAYYQRAIDLDPDFAEAHARMAVHYTQVAFFAHPLEAERVLPLANQHADRALELDPDLAWGHIAKVHYLLEKYHDAERLLPHLSLAEKADSNSAEILQQVGLSLGAAVGDWNGALPLLERGLELDPLRAESSFAVGFALFALRRHAEAEPHLKRALELDSEQHDYYFYLMWLYLSWRGDVETAVAMVQTAVENLGLERTVSGLNWPLTRFLAADAWYRDMLERISLGTPNLDSVNYYMHKATLYHALGDQDRARPYYDSTARIQESRIAATGELEGTTWGESQRHSELGLVYAVRGDGSAAIREAERALEMRRGMWGSRMVGMADLAQVYAILGEHEAAVQLYEVILAEPNVYSREMMAIDPFLESARQSPEFRQLMEEP